MLESAEGLRHFALRVGKAKAMVERLQLVLATAGIKSLDT